MFDGVLANGRGNDIHAAYRSAAGSLSYARLAATTHYKPIDKRSLEYRRLGSEVRSHHGR